MAEDFTDIQKKYGEEKASNNAPEFTKGASVEKEPELETPFFTELDDRGFIEVSGEEAESFLQDILTNDITQVMKGKTVYSLLLTPQGKVIYDFFVINHSGMFLLDCDKLSIPEIIPLLQKYAINKEITIKDVSSKCYCVAVYGGDVAFAMDEKATPGTTSVMPFGISYIDPRTNRMHLRSVCFTDKYAKHYTQLNLHEAERYIYEFLRIWCTVPDLRYDLVKGACFPLDYNFDQLNAIDFTKGCFVGQEVTARMKHKLERRKSFYPVTVMGAPPKPHTPIMLRGKKVGMFCSGIDTIGIAHLLKEHADWAKTTNTMLSTGGASLKVV